MPLPQLLTWLEERETASGRDWPLAHWRAVALGMLGRFDEARPILEEFLRILEERGDLVNLGLFRSQSASQLELLAGDPVTAARYAEEGCKLLEEVGEQGYLSTSCCYLGQALYALERLDEAEAWAEKGRQLGDSDDSVTQALSRQVQAKVLARCGQHREAEALAREAVALADSTETLVLHGNALSDLAEVLELAGRREEATSALREALERYERKEAIAPARQARERLAELQQPR
jgi:tetratricopeptide (TPR) repeat protein